MEIFKSIKSVLGLAGLVFVLASCSTPSDQYRKPATDTVIISGMKFNPEELYVNKWDTVIWVNKDMVSHDITAFPGKSWTSDTLKVGHSWKKVFGDSASYFCSIHPAMKGKIVVRK